MIKPVFVFDSRERFWPVGVDESLRLTKPLIRGGSLDSGVADHPSRMIADARAIDFGPRLDEHALGLLDPVVYHRMIHGDPLWWHQFWCWYVHNPWAIAGIGEHEGDWEFVQIGCIDKAGLYPVLVTGSQHHGGGKREAWACELHVASPVIYVARWSHANYFSLGRHDVDSCDGKGRRLEEYEIREFGTWATWPGRWGNSTGEGKSPESPGQQGIRWRAPHIFHTRSGNAS